LQSVPFPAPLGPSMVITGAIAVIFFSLIKAYRYITPRIIRANAHESYCCVRITKEYEAECRLIAREYGLICTSPE